jgi:K(+)-stimulated pyrophosphate-energized sodium pump
MNTIMIYLPIVMAIIGLLFMWIKRSWVLKQDAGDGKMKEISIYEGALAFLQAEYRLLAFFVVGASIVLAGLFRSYNTYINSSCLCFRCLSRLWLGIWE